MCLTCPLCDSHVSFQYTLKVVVPYYQLVLYPCESLRSPGRLSPPAQHNFLPQTSPPNFPPPSPPLERGYDLLEAGYYNPQEDTTPPDYPPSPAGLVATVGVGELPDERLDSLHCIPLDLPASPQPVFVLSLSLSNHCLCHCRCLCLFLCIPLDLLASPQPVVALCLIIVFVIATVLALVLVLIFVFVFVFVSLLTYHSCQSRYSSAANSSTISPLIPINPIDSFLLPVLIEWFLQSVLKLSSLRSSPIIICWHFSSLVVISVMYFHISYHKITITYFSQCWTFRPYEHHQTPHYLTHYQPTMTWALLYQVIYNYNDGVDYC